MRKAFSYKNGYSFPELAEMAAPFANLRLPFLGKYRIIGLLGEYIFGHSMSRFPIGVKSTLRRFLGGLFEPAVILHGKGKSLFVFTGDGTGRPDYLDCLYKVAAQCPDAVTVTVDRNHLYFRPWRIFGLLPELVWMGRINRIVHDPVTSFDMAVALFRVVMTGRGLWKRASSCGAERVTVFCDAWAAENWFVQCCQVERIPTATLQHGNGTEIFLGSVSDVYLANSLLSEENAVACGIPPERVRVVGPMKYAGEKYAPTLRVVHRIGIVFDGAQNFENNTEMLRCVHAASAGRNIRCLIRFHPNNRREDYASLLAKEDEICDSLPAFEQEIDFCVVYNSSMYTDMIYKRIPVMRYKNGRVDLFPALEDRGFSTPEELAAVLDSLRRDPEPFLAKQRHLYERVFGEACGANSYREFYEKWGVRHEG